MKGRRSITLFAVLFMLAGSSIAQPQNGKRSKTETKAEASLTGCVDEQNGRYILVDDRELKPIADLEADGFATESFAKHMGHLVTVRGTSNADSTPPVFRVRSIEHISDTCAPQQK